MLLLIEGDIWYPEVAGVGFSEMLELVVRWYSNLQEAVKGI